MNAEVGPGSVRRQRTDGLKTKGSKSLCNVGDSFMALYAMRINLWLIKLIVLYY